MSMSLCRKGLKILRTFDILLQNYFYYVNVFFIVHLVDRQIYYFHGNLLIYFPLLIYPGE